MTTFSSRIRLALAGVAVSAAFFPGFAAAADDVNVEIETNLGTIALRLDAARAPVTVKNFTNYAKAGFYDGTIFHRVIDGFMIQGGGFTPDMKQKKTNAPIVNEAANGLSNRRGTIARVRGNPIRLPRSFTSTSPTTRSLMPAKRATAGVMPSSAALPAAWPLSIKSHRPARVLRPVWGTFPCRP